MCLCETLCLCLRSGMSVGTSDMWSVPPQVGAPDRSHQDHFGLAGGVWRKDGGASPRGEVLTAGLCWPELHLLPGWRLGWPKPKALQTRWAGRWVSRGPGPGVLWALGRREPRARRVREDSKTAEPECRLGVLS